MKHITPTILGLAICVLATLAEPAGAVPQTVAFNGRLARADGTPVTGNAALTFTLFTAPSGGSQVWSEAHTAVAESSSGLVFAELGATAPLTGAVFDGADRWLEISVNGETLSPRLAIQSVPYALRASDSDRLGGLAPADLQARVGGACPAGSSISAIAGNGGVTCEADDVGVTGVTPGTGLTGGGASGNVTLSVNSAVVQARVTGTCGAGSAIASVSATGAVTCAATSLTACTWENEMTTTSIATQDATCPTGKHAISGGCDPAGTATVAFTRPFGPPADGAPASGVSAWNCQFSAPASGHRAYALCCSF